MGRAIGLSVGRWERGAKNQRADVITIQELLKAAAQHLKDPALDPGIVDGLIARNGGRSGTVRAIERFQGSFMRTPDGLIEPAKGTLQRLNDAAGLGGPPPLAPRPSGSSLFSMGNQWVSLERLKVNVDQIPALRGAGIALIGNGMSRVLRHSQHVSGLTTFVILREGSEVEAPSAAASIGRSSVPSAAPNIALELGGIALNCGGAALAAAALTGEIIALPATGGASAALILLTKVALWATATQCANSIIRTVDVVWNDGDLTRWLDSTDGYNFLTRALDVISLAGVATSASATIRAAIAIRRATNRPWLQILKSMNRQERRRLAKEIVRLDHPGASNQRLKAVMRADNIASRLRADEVSERLLVHLKDSLAASLAFGSSALSGTIRQAYVYIYQE